MAEFRQSFWLTLFDVRLVCFSRQISPPPSAGGKLKQTSKQTSVHVYPS